MNASHVQYYKGKFDTEIISIMDQLDLDQNWLVFFQNLISFLIPIFFYMISHFGTYTILLLCSKYFYTKIDKKVQRVLSTDKFAVSLYEAS